MKLSRCGCSPNYLVRLHRPLWVRWFLPSRVLFLCTHCRAKQLLQGR